jgi:hypothetical protein
MANRQREMPGNLPGSQADYPAADATGQEAIGTQVQSFGHIQVNLDHGHEKAP